MIYRREIDGLRAVAVAGHQSRAIDSRLFQVADRLPCLQYHLGLNTARAKLLRYAPPK